MGPASTGKWIFRPELVKEEVVEESPPSKAEGDDENGDETGEAEKPPEEPQGDEDDQEKPPEPEKPDLRGVDIHSWLFNGLNRCYASDDCVQRVCAAGVLESEVRACKEWLAKTERAGFWGPLTDGVLVETSKRIQDERTAREEARKEERRQKRA